MIKSHQVFVHPLIVWHRRPSLVDGVIDTIGIQTISYGQYVTIQVRGVTEPPTGRVVRRVHPS